MLVPSPSLSIKRLVPYFLATNTTGQRYRLSTSVKYFEPFQAMSPHSRCDLNAARFCARHFGNDCVDTAFFSRRSDRRFSFPTLCPLEQWWPEKTSWGSLPRPKEHNCSRCPAPIATSAHARDASTPARRERRSMRKGLPLTSGARAAALPPRGNHVAPSFPSLAGWARATAGEARGSSR